MIRIEKVHKTLGGQPVLRGVNLTVRSGEVLALVGGSGAGKSVLLKHVIGLMLPDEGEVFVAGRPVGRASFAELAELRRRMGYVFQDGALLDSLTIRENLRLAMADEDCARDAYYCPRRIVESLATVNLDDSVLDKHPDEISGGMRKRVGVARAIIHRPDIILYDEPTTGLDPQNVVQVNEVILKARQQLGATSLMVTHDVAALRAVADRVALLADGCVRFQGTPGEFFDSANPSVRSFLGRRAGALAEVA
ncbi:MAG: ATP-binding cassette domain-containing protein [Gemmatimonadetes bacterium]|nr:ATP-binding cassette domain-containing protein [Gemmatimonadota bacterium]